MMKEKKKEVKAARPERDEPCRRRVGEITERLRTVKRHLT
jgi:hypothetical protein